MRKNCTARRYFFYASKTADTEYSFVINYEFNYKIGRRQHWTWKMLKQHRPYKILPEGTCICGWNIWHYWHINDIANEKIMTTLLTPKLQSVWSVSGEYFLNMYYVFTVEKSYWGVHDLGELVHKQLHALMNVNTRVWENKMYITKRRYNTSVIVWTLHCVLQILM